MLGQELTSHAAEKDLGVLIDKELKFRRQAAAAANKANQILGVIKRAFAHLDLYTRLQYDLPPSSQAAS